MSTELLSSEGAMWPGIGSNHSPPTSAEVQMCGATPPLPRVFMVHVINYTPQTVLPYNQKNVTDNDSNYSEYIFNIYWSLTQ
jgi:hypothetical protein